MIVLDRIKRITRINEDLMLSCNGKIIARKIVDCDNLFKKGTGLMFTRKTAVDDTAWLFSFKRSQRVDITMIFVFYPIDIIFLDEKGRIVELKENLRPFLNYRSHGRITHFLEVAQGAIRRFRLKNGMYIKF